MQRLAFVLTSWLLGGAHDAEQLNARVWRMPGKYEMDRGVNALTPEAGVLPAGPNTGLCVSGGGFRAYTVAMGVFRALADLDMMKDVRYLVGVSGGAWATSAFTYGQNVPDEALLGVYWEPEDLTIEKLSRVEENSALRAPQRNFWPNAVEIILANLFFRWGITHGWEQTISRVILEPLGVPRNSVFTWDEETKADILERNPGLAKETWVLPARGPGYVHRPYPIMETTLLGPWKLTPVPIGYREYTQCEVTPLYVGRPYTTNITYMSGAPVETVNTLVGGFVEPFAYGGAGPVEGLAAGVETGILTLPRPTLLFSLAMGISQSSWDFGALVSQSARWLAEFVGMTQSYWSPSSTSPRDTLMDISDGGNLENTGILSMLRRRVDRIVVVISSPVPLQPAEVWDPQTMPNETDIDSQFASLFGVFITPLTEQSWNYRSNHVFNKEDFPAEAAKLQAAQAAGRGAVVNTQLCTVQNDRWGIREGFCPNITWIYLARLGHWEERLPRKIAEHVVGPAGSSEGPRSGPFENFPFYPTMKLEYTARQTNLLSVLGAATIRLNEDLIRQTLGSGSDEKEKMTSPSKKPNPNLASTNFQPDEHSEEVVV